MKDGPTGGRARRSAGVECTQLAGLAGLAGLVVRQLLGLLRPAGGRAVDLGSGVLMGGLWGGAGVGGAAPT